MNKRSSGNFEVARIDVPLQSEEHLKNKLYEKTTTDHLIQTLIVNLSPFSVKFTYLRPDPYGFDNNSLKFITDETKLEVADEAAAGCEVNKCYFASGLTR